MRELTTKKLRALIQDEKKACKEYKKYGFVSLSKDECGHSKFLQKKMK